MPLPLNAGQNVRVLTCSLKPHIHVQEGRLENMIELAVFQPWMAGESLWIREADKIRAFCAAVTSKRQEVFCV